MGQSLHFKQIAMENTLQILTSQKEGKFTELVMEGK